MNPTELVEALYRALLGRTVEPSGLAFWTDLIQSTGDPTVVMRGILESEEYANRSRPDGNQPCRSQITLEPFAPPSSRSVAERVEMTTSCRDTDPIPKVTGAGEVFMGPENTWCQRMHNGLTVVAKGYHGEWMSEVIRRLRGHHEPQEELLFHAALPWMAPDQREPVMVELGAFWSYYSLWFRTIYPHARSIMVEPDSSNRQMGEKNFALNGFQGEFIEAAVGVHNGSMPFQSESDGIVRSVRTVSVDGLVKDLRLERIHVLHADIQGFEEPMLTGLVETVKMGGLDWLFLSTHHHSISHNPLTHQHCLRWIKDQGATIIEEHSVVESFSGDGLIVARFGDVPEIKVPPISRNVPSRSLFREMEYDLAEAASEIQRLQVRLEASECRSPNPRRDADSELMSSLDGRTGALANFERKWRSPEAREAVRQLVSAQIQGELFPNLPESSEPGYYFLHIPKTAGTSVNRFLESLCPRLGAWLWDQLIERERIGAPTSAALISGHFHMHLEPFIGTTLKRLTMLRDPVARTISHYLHVKRSPEHPYFEMVQSLSLLEFCTHPKTRHMVSNYQARYLVDFGIDVRVAGALCTEEELSSFQLQDCLERLTLDAVPEDLLLSAAEANLASFAAIGVADRFPEAMRRFAAVFGYDDVFSLFDERHNVAPEPLAEANLDSQTRLAILGATQVDLALYRSVSKV